MKTKILSVSVLIILSSLSVTSCGSKKEKNTEETTTQAKEEPPLHPDVKIYSRDKFEELFYSKPRSFVENRLGTADKEQELFAINVTWLWYKHKTYIQSPDEPDEWVKVRFDDFVGGKVDKINYK